MSRDSPAPQLAPQPSLVKRPDLLVNESTMSMKRNSRSVVGMQHETDAHPAKNSYGSIVVMICDYRLNSKNFVHDDCTCFVRFTQASYKRRGFNKSRL